MSNEPFRLKPEEKQTPRQRNLEAIRASKIPFREANRGECLCFREPGKPQCDFYPSTGRWRNVGTNQTLEGGANAFLSSYRTEPQPQPNDKDTNVPKLNEMFPSRFLKASDIDDGADMVLTIDSLKMETLGQGRDSQEKWVVFFKETAKGLVLNKTNTNVIAKLYGDDTDEWAGCKVALFATEVQFKDEMVLSIRVRTRVPKVAVTKTAPVKETVRTAADGPAGMPDRSVNLGDRPGFDETAEDGPSPSLKKLLRKYDLTWPYDLNAVEAIKDEATDKDFAALIAYLAEADLPF